MTTEETLAPLPPDLEIEVYRAVAGEELKWWGRSSGVVEKFQGGAIMVVGAFIIIVGLGVVSSVLEVVAEVSGGTGQPEFETVVGAVVGLFFVALAFGLIIFGWRTYRASAKIVWIVTNRRLIRLVAGTTHRLRSWTKGDIVEINLRTSPKDGAQVLLITLTGGRRSRPALTIMGPTDLEVAEAALGELEDG